ncbi:MAG: hypothetical protein E7L00_08415 [Propionibacteriaceae bacterium]|nr:hypothetical protein [Propionibacteriaceae bacterium]
MSDVYGAGDYEPRPTYWNKRPASVPLVMNPNRCEVCHRFPHAPTPHHSFTPDRATEAQARALGWPIPNQQEPLL